MSEPLVKAEGQQAQQPKSSATKIPTHLEEQLKNASPGDLQLILMGPKGSGKTHLVNLLSGQDGSSDGTNADAHVRIIKKPKSSPVSATDADKVIIWDVDDREYQGGDEEALKDILSFGLKTPWCCLYVTKGTDDGKMGVDSHWRAEGMRRLESPIFVPEVTGIVINMINSRYFESSAKPKLDAFKAKVGPALCASTTYNYSVFAMPEAESKAARNTNQVSWMRTLLWKFVEEMHTKAKQLGVEGLKKIFEARKQNYPKARWLGKEKYEALQREKQQKTQDSRAPAQTTSANPNFMIPLPLEEDLIRPRCRPLAGLTEHALKLMVYMRKERAAIYREVQYEHNVVAIHNEWRIKQSESNNEPILTGFDSAAIARKPSTRAYIDEVVQAYRSWGKNASLTKALARTIDEVSTSAKHEAYKRLRGGLDDREGHFVVCPYDFILDGRLLLLSVVGKGSFGTVVRAVDRKTEELVAVKISRTGSYFVNQARVEVKILLTVNAITRLNTLVVKLRKYALHQDHAVLVFPLLSVNLYQLLKLSKLQGVSLELTKKLVVQMIQVLYDLERCNPPIIHSDLKPENVLLYDQSRSGIRVIDFGSACFDEIGVEKHKYIQSRFYRSPEVILGLPYGTAIDRWSVGCIAVEMHTGAPLFPGRSEPEQLARMFALLGPPPKHMIDNCTKKQKLFKTRSDGSVVGSSFSEALVQKVCPSYPTSLHDVIGTKIGGPRGCRLNQAGHSRQDYENFYDFLTGLLTYDPEKRLSCGGALKHPFLKQNIE